MPIENIADHPVRTPMWSGGEADMVDLMLPAVVGFAISQVVLGLMLIALNPRTSLQQRLYGVLLLTLMGYFLAPFAAGTPWNIGVITLMTGVPGIFWLFSASLFDDHFRLQSWQLSLVLATVCLPFVDLLARQLGFVPAPVWVVMLVDIPAMLELLLVGLAVMAVIRHWRVDLVQSRRDLRLWFCGVNGVYLFVLLILREVFYPYFSWLNYVQYASAAIVLLITNGMLLRVRSGLLVPGLAPLGAADPEKQGRRKGVRSSSAVVAEANISADLLEQLHDLMDNEHIYRDMGLTIGQLAHRLNLLEHRLRVVINGGLGYRNFNDFLNSYRVREAAERLRDPEEAKLPVTSIAMDVGFNSLSTFNKAFKSKFELTPTAFRRKHLPGPGTD